jgi:phage/plasmid-like protein (TIGR03299 family)
MPADIHRDQQGRDSMFSLRQTPWHQLGKVIDTELRDEEVLTTALLNWTVDGEPVYAFRPGVDAEGNAVQVTEPVEGYKLLRRSDSGAQYGVVGQGYRVYQNREMIDLLRRIAGETPIVWETAGALGTGQNVWVLGRLPEMDLDIGHDKTRTYMLVCANTFGLAVGGIQEDRGRAQNLDRLVTGGAYTLSEGFSIRHTGGLDVAVRDVARAYQRVVKGHQATQEAMELLASRKVSYAEASQLWEAIFSRPSAADETVRGQTIRENRDLERKQSLHALWLSQTNQVEGTANTAFSAYQTAVEYIDHVRPTRGEGNQAAKRLKYGVFGEGWNLKAKAFSLALETATAKA